MFVLGSIEAGCYHELVLNDGAKLVQEVDLTNVDLIRVNWDIRIPDSTPAGYAWEISVLVDDTEKARLTCPPGTRRNLNDLAANVSKITGHHLVGIGIRLIENA